MSGPSLQRAAALSMAVHVALFFMGMAVARNPFLSLTPKVYEVTIYTPEVKPPETKRNHVEPPPPPTKRPKTKPKRAPRKQADIPRQYVSEKLDAIKTKKEKERYMSERLEDIQKRKKIQSIRQLAASRAAKAESASAKAEILDGYKRKIQAEIYEGWVFPDIDIKNLEALISIRILKNGSITVNRFESPSGSKPFDRSALKAINKASPVEPPPFGAPIDEIIVRFIPHDEN
jgi:colicin import membrane protein